MEIMILDKLAALSVARKAIRNNKPKELIIAELLKCNYFQNRNNDRSKSRSLAAIERIFFKAQQQEKK